MSYAKEVKALLKPYQSRGWEISLTGKNHLRMHHPDIPNSIVIAPGTSTHNRALKNLRVRLDRLEASRNTTAASPAKPHPATS